MEGDEIRVKRLKDDINKLRAEAETQTQDGSAQHDVQTLQQDKSKLGRLQHQFTQLMEELSKVDEEHDKQEQLKRNKQAKDEHYAKLLRGIDEKRSRIARVIGSSTDIWQMLEDNQLIKKISEAKRLREAERESQAQQVAAAQSKLQKKENEIFAKQSELTRQRSACPHRTRGLVARAADPC